MDDDMSPTSGDSSYELDGPADRPLARRPTIRQPGRLSKRLLWLVTVGVALGLVVSGVAYAAIPSSGGVISGCYIKALGYVRVIDKAAGQQCERFETPIEWNKSGPTGPPGATGPAGRPVQRGRPDPPVQRERSDLPDPQVRPGHQDRQVPPGRLVRLVRLAQGSPSPSLTLPLSHSRRVTPWWKSPRSTWRMEAMQSSPPRTSAPDSRLQATRSTTSDARSTAELVSLGALAIDG